MTDLNQLGFAGREAAQTLRRRRRGRRIRRCWRSPTRWKRKPWRFWRRTRWTLLTAALDGLSDAMLDRLLLNEKRLAALAADVRKVAALHDPVGVQMEGRLLPNGMRLEKRRIPIGVIGVIYEARPNVTVDVASLCLKTGNAAILRGGSETLRSNLALVQAIQRGLTDAGLPTAAVQYVDDPDRALVTELLRLDQYVDMIIPRGGAALHRLCREQGTIPVITGGIGICHIYVDESADLARAVEIIENAKVQRPSVCNALDTLLVHRAVAREFLPAVARRLAQSKVELRPTGEALAILEGERRRRNGGRCRPRRLRHRMAGADPGRQGGGWAGGGDRAHPGAQHRTFREHPDEQPDQRRRASWMRSTRRRCSSTPARASTTAGSSAWAPRSR